MGAGLLDEDERGFVERHKNSIVSALLLPIAFCLPFLLLIVYGSVYDFFPSEFWVKLPDVEGLDRSTDVVTAPTFHITLRVNYERPRGNHALLCGKGDRVDVAYEGVPIAHGDLPEFCVPAGIVGSVPVVAKSEGLGLPDELYERMESQRRRHERACRWWCACG